VVVPDQHASGAEHAPYEDGSIEVIGGVFRSVEADEVVVGVVGDAGFEKLGGIALIWLQLVAPPQYRQSRRTDNNSLKKQVPVSAPPEETSGKDIAENERVTKAVS